VLLIAVGALLRKLVDQNPQETLFRNQITQLYLAQRRFGDAEKELCAVADASPADSKPGMDLVRFLIAAKGAAAARTELGARIKAGGDVFDYQIATAALLI
jgi:hypothetical protein